jgi:hypothetical protein
VQQSVPGILDEFLDDLLLRQTGGGKLLAELRPQNRWILQATRWLSRDSRYSAAPEDVSAAPVG